MGGCGIGSCMTGSEGARLCLAGVRCSGMCRAGSGGARVCWAGGWWGAGRGAGVRGASYFNFIALVRGGRIQLFIGGAFAHFLFSFVFQFMCKATFLQGSLILWNMFVEEFF